jgi:hypothetical protein
MKKGMITLLKLVSEKRKENTIVQHTLGFQILTFNGPSSIGFSITGCGHCHLYIIKKNLETKVDAVAFGYNWHTRATNIAHATPPRNPITLE